jgi:hypothetical protein
MHKLSCLIVRQPYASLIAFGKKRWEFRSYNTERRGAMGIAASHGRPWITACPDLNEILHLMPRGVVLATCELKSSFLVTSKDLENSKDNQLKQIFMGKKS